MANSEACDLYIEQQIKEGLDDGKTPYAIGKELAAWVEKLFETTIKPTTIEKRAERQMGTSRQMSGDKSNSQQKQPTADIPKLTDAGGNREGSGRPPKFRVINQHDRRIKNGMRFLRSNRAQYEQARRGDLASLLNVRAKAFDGFKARKDGSVS